MSARRLPVATRAVLTLAGVAATSVLLLLAATEVSIATQGERVAPWVGLLLFVVAGGTGWLTVWAAAGRNPLGAVDPAARVPRRLVVARVLLAATALVLLLLALSLPFPPRRWQETTTLLADVALLLAASYAALTVTHRDPGGRYVTVALGAWLTSQLVRTTYLLAHVPTDPGAGPARALGYLVGWGCFGAAILAALCVVSLRGDWPPRNRPPADGVVS